MANQTSQPARTLDRVDLERVGFSQEEIGRIVALRERYHPLIEEDSHDRLAESLTAEVNGAPPRPPRIPRED